jgi:nucleoside-diphosphate kinase
MTTQRTLSIIKPDAVKKNVAGHIISRFEQAGLRVIALKKVHLTPAVAGEFYAEHKERPFFGELVDFMTSGACIPLVLEGENAILKNRELMGATNPTKAEAGTLRADFAMPCTDLSANAVHGSDSEASAAREIAFFFSGAELL